jgi:hypothetical protein
MEGSFFNLKPIRQTVLHYRRQRYITSPIYRMAMHGFRTRKVFPSIIEKEIVLPITTGVMDYIVTTSNPLLQKVIRSCMLYIGMAMTGYA